MWRGRTRHPEETSCMGLPLLFILSWTTDNNFVRGENIAKLELPLESVYVLSNPAWKFPLCSCISVSATSSHSSSPRSSRHEFWWVSKRPQVAVESYIYPNKILSTVFKIPLCFPWKYKSFNCWKHNTAFGSSSKVFSIPNSEERNTFLRFFHTNWFLGFFSLFHGWKCCNVWEV